MSDRCEKNGESLHCGLSFAVWVLFVCCGGYLLRAEVIWGAAERDALGGRRDFFDLFKPLPRLRRGLEQTCIFLRAASLCEGGCLFQTPTAVAALRGGGLYPTPTVCAAELRRHLLAAPR